MAEVKKILASVDMSEFNELVMEYVADLLKGKEGAEVIIFSVINQRDIDHVEDVRNYFAGLGSQGVTTKKYIEKETSTRTAKMEELGKKYLDGINVKYSVVVDAGHPADKIIKAAKENTADLIVMANKGKGNLAKTIFGSVALRVLRHSPVPVLSVRNFK